MGKRILRFLLYLIAVAGVIFWLGSTEGLTEEGALLLLGITLFAYFVMKLIGFSAKRHRRRKERARKARKKRELREAKNHRKKQETDNNRSEKWQSKVETYVPDVEKWNENIPESGYKFPTTRKKVGRAVGGLAILCIVVLAGKTWIRQQEQIPESLLTMEEKYPEAAEFVKNYPKRKHYRTIDISSEVETARENSEIPCFLQWDERWGYETYGSDFLAVTGCGPTCLSMVTCGLTGSKEWNPLAVAQFSEKEGYYVPGEGTSWSLMTEGAQTLGLTAENIPVTEETIRTTLQSGTPMICSMYPGDFTYTGHFIVLTGIDENGSITVNDPNSPANTQKHWPMSEILPQIRQSWGYRT